MALALATILALWLCVACAGAITLPTHIASSMVIQRDVPFPLWGVDTPGATVTVALSSGGGAVLRTVAGGDGVFNVTLPAAPASTAPVSITLTSSSGGGALVLEDILFGDVFLESGQSNAELSVVSTVNWTAVAARAGAHGATLRLFQVAMLDAYTNASAPARNLSASIPWGRASAQNVPAMSAQLYYFGVYAVEAHPDVPVGLIATSWGGVSAQVWMSPRALAQCGDAAAPPPSPEERIAAAAGGRGAAALAVLARAALHAGARRGAFPTRNSCLYYSMLCPLLSVPIRGILWYQGETNAGDPVGYQCLLKSLITDWRASWAELPGSDQTLPFSFVQLSAWPTGDAAYLPVMRVAMEAALVLPRTGMQVSADIADAAGALHPIHPPWKAELGRRTWLWADAVVYGNASSPASGPRVVDVAWDAWDPTWGDYHFGYGGGSYACEGGGAGWICAGVRVMFDQPIAIRGFYQPAITETLDGSAPVNYYGFMTGADSGFELWQGAGGAPGSWWQPAALTGLCGANCLQLNVTWVPPAAGAPALLRYAWHDYPHAMPIVNGAGLPAGPFNASLDG